MLQPSGGDSNMMWVLVDLSWLAHRAMHSMKDMEHDDVPTGVVYGFFTSLRQICLDEKVRSCKIAICCDSRTSKRTDFFDKYKHRRHADKDEEEIEKLRAMRKQVAILRDDVLPAMGFPVLQQDGLESDDLMAWVARRISNNARLLDLPARAFPEAVMITSDGDLYQMISPWVHWYDPSRKKYHTEESFQAIKGVHPKAWGMVKAISGCTTDTVPGVGGVGEKGAIQYIMGDLPKKSKKHATIVSDYGKAVITRNKRLVVLPHEETEPIILKEPTYKTDAFFKCCKRFGLYSILRERGNWEAFFAGKHFAGRMAPRGFF